MSQDLQSSSKKGWISRHPIWTAIIGLFSISLIYTVANSSSAPTVLPTASSDANKQAQVAQQAVPAKPEDVITSKMKEALPELRVNGDYTIKGTLIGKEDSDAPKGTQMLTVNVNVDSYLNQEWMIRDTGKISSEAFRQTFASSLPIYDASAWYYADTTDKYGNKTNDVVLTYHVNKEIFAKINWDGFNPENLCNFLIDEGRKDPTSAGCEFHANVK